MQNHHSRRVQNAYNAIFICPQPSSSLRLSNRPSDPSTSTSPCLICTCILLWSDCLVLEPRIDISEREAHCIQAKVFHQLFLFTRNLVRKPEHLLLLW